MKSDLLILLSGAAGAAIIKLIDGVIQWILSRVGKGRDAQRIALKDLEKRLERVEAGNMSMLLDRIQHLCKSYIADGSVDTDDLRRLHIMHTNYHTVGGNGDLDKLMSRVDALPLRRDY